MTKRNTLIAIFLFAVFQLSAQDKPREVGLLFNGLNFDGYNSLSGILKKQKSENVYRRYRFAFGQLSTVFVDETTEVALGAGIAIGKEKRKSLDDKLVFFSGPEFAANFGIQAVSEDDTQIDFGFRFGWIFGLQHSFNDRWAINIETIPSVGISFLTLTEREFTRASFDAGLSNLVSLGVVRKF